MHSPPAPHVAVVQPLPGIGDMIWHLPHIRAIADHVGAPITLLAKPRSMADQLFMGESTIRGVLWVDRNPDDWFGSHDGGRGWGRLVASIRKQRFSAVYVLHHSRTLAFLSLAAGIPVRYGYGFGTQRLFLNRGPYLPRAAFPLHPFEQASQWLRAAGITLSEAEPLLPIHPAARQALKERLGPAPESLVAIGVGSSEAYKQWGTERFAALAKALRREGWRPLVMIGGAAEAPLIEAVRNRIGDAGRDVIAAADWPLPEVAALLAQARFYIGNDTGVMNMAAAVGTQTYGLFGATPPFHHSGRIIPIEPPDGPDKFNGMAGITPDAVMATIHRAFPSGPPGIRSRARAVSRSDPS